MTHGTPGVPRKVHRFLHGVFSNPEMSMNGPLGGAEGGCEGEG